MTPPDRPTRLPGEPAPRSDASLRGIRYLVAALGGLLLVSLLGTAWIVWKAIENPDVRAKRPSWLEDGQAFDASFWSPLLLTVVIGAGIVAWVLWKAYRRLRDGEDLYAQRLGQGLRRRGERFVGRDDPPTNGS